MTLTKLIAILHADAIRTIGNIGTNEAEDLSAIGESHVGNRGRNRNGRDVNTMFLDKQRQVLSDIILVMLVAVLNVKGCLTLCSGTLEYQAEAESLELSRLWRPPRWGTPSRVLGACIPNLARQDNGARPANWEVYHDLAASWDFTSDHGGHGTKKMSRLAKPNSNIIGLDDEN